MKNSNSDTLLGKVVHAYALMRVLQRHVDNTHLDVSEEVIREEALIWKEQMEDRDDS